MRTFPVNFIAARRAVLWVSLLAALCAPALPAASEPLPDAPGETADDGSPESLGLDLRGGAAGFSTFTYTKLDLDKCEVVDKSAPDEEGPGWAHWRCNGLTEDWPVHVMEGDLRFTVSYGPDGPNEPAAQKWFAPFNRIHDTLEWVKAGEEPGKLKPVATILRFFLSAGDGSTPREHPILVVTQLKPGAVCHVAYLDALANKNANQDAREAAMRLAGSFNCEAEPELVGPQSPGVFAE